MSRSLTAQDRSSLIRLASSLPSGSPERKAILAGLSKTSEEGLVNCPNCIGSGSVQVPDKGRALHDSKPCPDCKGKKMVSPDRAKAIERSINKSANFRSPVRGSFRGASAELGPKLSADVAKYDMAAALAKWGADVVAVYLKLPVDMEIGKLAMKIRAVQKALGEISPAQAYERNDNLLRNAIRSAGLDLSRVS